MFFKVHKSENENAAWPKETVMTLSERDRYELKLSCSDQAPEVLRNCGRYVTMLGFRVFMHRNGQNHTYDA